MATTFTVACAVTLLITMHAVVNSEESETIDCSKNPGDLQCTDGYRNCSRPNWFRCKDGQCIGEHFVCDGHNDCRGNEDESSCGDYTPHHQTVNCTASDFKCISDQLCIPIEKVCDNVTDCIDNSDEEEGCRVIKDRCKGFLCKNRRCLSDLSWVCDGRNDCQDNSDEQDCNSVCSPDTRKFKCESTGNCISTKKVCDNKKDCTDGSDEGGQCARYKNNTACAIGTCPTEAECFIWPTGPQCGCPNGFRYDVDIKACEDINECDRYGVCSQGCENTRGSYRCTCASKFKLKSDGRSCSVFSTVEPLLLYAGDHSIHGIRLTSNHHFVVHDQIQHVVGISSDGHYVYWTDLYKQQEKIMRSLEDGSKEETLVMAGIRSVEDIAVDWMTMNLYFTDGSYKHIAVCTNEGHHCKTLIQSDDDSNPRGIALYPQQGSMYWTDWGARPMIGVSNMDGSDWKTLITHDIFWPNGIALDWPNGRLYWVDAKLDRIESVNFLGSDRRIVLEKLSKHPYGLAIFGSNIYWSDWSSKSIQTCDKFTGKQRSTLVADRMIYGVHIYHPAMYPKHSGPCEGNKCSHLCLLKSNSSFSCACPNNMYLNEDQRTCSEMVHKQAVIVAAGNIVLTYDHQNFGKHSLSTMQQLKYYVHKMAYNSLTGDVFAADNDHKLIYSLSSNSKRITVLIDTYIGNVSSLAFDFLGNNLYWTDSELSTIEVLSLDTKYRATVQHFKGTESPLAMAVIPEQGFILVALRSRYGHTHFNRLAMHGRGAYHHVWESGLGDGTINFYVNERDEHIYWSDSAYGQISLTDYECKMNHTVKSDIKGANSLSVLDSDMYWTSLNEPWMIFFSPISLPQLTKAIPVDLQDEIILIASTPTKVVDHPCQPPKGAKRPCSHICVPITNSTFACLCPAGLVFEDSRNLTCIEAHDCYFHCRSGQCISKAQHCNGHKDCPDSSDEELCDYHPKSLVCSSDQFRCSDGNKCIDKKLRCDLNHDCEDESDETNCEHYNTTIKCLKTQFECTNGMCIDASSRCDTMNDCEDGSDELRCDPLQCKYRNMFACSSGQCLDQAWECDGTMDCNDGSDEHNCGNGRKCAPGFYQCPHGQCIDGRLVCNGLNDCGDNSDELSCVNHSKTESCDTHSAEPTEYQCITDHSVCIPIAAKCNGTAECPRGEDEDGCTKCGLFRFECKNSQCIPLTFRCNNEDNCGDGSDEINCFDKKSKTVGQACQDHMFNCMNEDGECMEMSKVCNGKKDCSNGKDEGGKCEEKCTDGMCDHICDRSPYGPTCSCNNGFELGADKRSCEDIDECETLNPCAQKCENTVGSYRCSCFLGFMLRNDKTKCKSHGDREYMLFSTFDTIYNESERQRAVTWSVKNTRFTGLDVNIAMGLLYYTVEESQSLYEFNISTKRIRYMNGVGTPTKLAVDWSTNNVYVVDRSVPAAIRICHLAEKVCVRLLQLSVGDVVQTIRVDAFNNRLFYTILHKWDYSNPISIVYSRLLDGTRPNVMVNSAIHVSDLTFDPNKKLLYYAEMDNNAIYSIHYDGKDHRKIIFDQPNIWKPNAIGLFQDELTVLSVGSNKAVRCKTYDNFECSRPHELNAFNMENLIMVQETKQRPMVNKCANNKCSMVCVPAERGPKCLCADGVHVEPSVQCHDVTTNEVGILHGDDALQDDTNTVGIVVGVISGLLCVTVLTMAVYVAYKKKLIRRKFVARVHFQNPAAQNLGTSSPKKMHAPVLSTGVMRNEIFLNDINSDDMSECGSSPPADEEFMYGGSSIRSKLIRTNSR